MKPASLLLVCAAAAASVFQGQECGPEKGCFLHPPDCTDGAGDCLAGVSYQWADFDLVQLELFARGTGIYIALGFSTERLMGRDYVVYCTSSYNNYRPGDVGIGYNPGGKQSTIMLETDYFNPVRSYEARTIDGMTYCRLNITTTVPQVHELTEFRSLNTSYYLMLAAGASSHPDKITYHSFHVVSDYKVNVAKHRKPLPYHPPTYTQPPEIIDWNPAAPSLARPNVAEAYSPLPTTEDPFATLFSDLFTPTTTTTPPPTSPSSFQSEFNELLAVLTNASKPLLPPAPEGGPTFIPAQIVPLGEEDPTIPPPPSEPFPQEEFILDTSQLPPDPELGFPQISFSTGTERLPTGDLPAASLPSTTTIRLPAQPPDEFAWVPLSSGGVSVRPVDLWDVTRLTTPAEVESAEEEPYLLAHAQEELAKENFLVSALFRLLQETVADDDAFS